MVEAARSTQDRRDTATRRLGTWNGFLDTFGLLLWTGVFGTKAFRGRLCRVAFPLCPFIALLQVTVALATGNHQRVLVLGLGIGAIPNTLRAIRPEMVIDIVEIDAAVIEGAMKYANVVQDDRMHVYEADAAQFVRRPDRQSYYDVVILDCFDPEGIPAVFHAKEFYENAVACLRPQGVFSTNLIWTLKEAPEIKDHLRECLAAPLSIYNSSESNCAIFGRAVADPAGPLVLDDVMHAAQAVDAENVLPYFLEPQVKRAAPLFVSKTARRVPSGVEA